VAVPVIVTPDTFGGASGSISTMQHPALAGEIRPQLAVTPAGNQSSCLAIGRSFARSDEDRCEPPA
jgi:hypothetical protein